MDAQHDEENPIPAAGTPWPDEHKPTDLEREDDRWSPRAQLQDWLVLLAMITAYLVWAGLVYFLEPGIR